MTKPLLSIVYQSGDVIRAVDLNLNLDEKIDTPEYYTRVLAPGLGVLRRAIEDANG